MILLRHLRRRWLHVSSVTQSINTDLTKLSTQNPVEFAHVTFDDGHESIFPNSFLRDNCLCPQCFHASSRQRIVDTMSTAPLDIKAIQTHVEAGDLCMLWEDGHASTYSAHWLRERDCETPKQNYAQLRLWRGQDFELKVFDFEALMHDDAHLRAWITDLWTQGLCKVTNVPKAYGQLQRFGARVSPVGLRRTNYGETFHVSSKVDANNLAYTTRGLDLHTDLCYYKHKPDIQMLHCIEQADIGGENTFVDAFQVALDFQRDHPEAFERLTTHAFTYNDEGADAFGPFDIRCERSLIELNHEGQLQNINFSNFTRDSFLNGTCPKAEVALMDAYFQFSNYVHHPTYRIACRMEAGDMMCFYNHRILHGREPFVLNNHTSEQVRRLEGGYLDWDLVYSKLRTLDREP